MIERIKLIDGLIEANLPSGEFLVVNSAWLSMMGLRINGDLDVIITRHLWDTQFPENPLNQGFGIPGRYQKRLRVHAYEGGPYLSLERVESSDQLIRNHCVEVDGFPFIEPRIYFRYKLLRLARVQKLIAQIPFFRRNKILSGYRKKLFTKRDKDLRDFQLLRGFFAEKKYKNLEFKFLTEEQWGLNDANLRVMLLGS